MLVTAALTAAGCGAAASAAGATTLHTTPGGPPTGSCSTLNPCDIEYAVELLAGDGDEIVVGEGTYDVPNTISIDDDDLYLHGEPGAPRPLVTYASSGQPTLAVSAAGVRVSDLAVEMKGDPNAPTTAVVDNAATRFDRVQMRSVNQFRPAVFSTAGDSVVTNSTLAADNASTADAAVVVDGGSPEFVNDTILGDGQIAFFAAGGTPELVNTIVDGDTDVVAIGGQITTDHSNFDEPAQGGGGTITNTNQQMELPLFVDRAAGDLHEAAGSPTINAGIADSRSALDFESEGRGNGAAPDIGADEFYADGPVRYAAPDGPGIGNCSAPGAACRVERVVNNVAESGNEVIVAPGTYDLRSPLAAGLPLDVHGPAGGPRPVLRGTFGSALLLLFPGSTLRGLDLRNNDMGLSSAGGSTIDRVFASSRDVNATAVVLDAGDTFTNSVAWAHGEGSSTGVFAALSGAESVTLHNVTAVADGLGNSAAITLFGTGGGAAAGAHPTMNLRNVIAQGGNGPDLRAQAVNGGPTPDRATIVVGNSNYAVPDSSSGGGAMSIDASPGGNQSDPPQFADAANGDFHQLTGSPTVNAGAPVPSLLDLDGDPRELGSAPDIGADETVPPPGATTAAASDVGVAGATLNGSVDPEGRTTTVYFEYGLTTSYGSRTPDVAVGSGTAPVAASALLAGLAPGTAFHYRVVAVNAMGRSDGADATFTTTALTPAGGGGGGTGGTGGSGGGTPPPIPPTPDTLAPGISGFTATKKSFRVGTGTRFRFRLTEAAGVSFTFQRREPGRRSGSRCVKPTKKNRKARKCTRLVKRGVLTASGVTGANDVPFTGRIGGKAMPVGTYQVTLLATDAAGNKSAARKLTVKIVRR